MHDPNQPPSNPPTGELVQTGEHLTDEQLAHRIDELVAEEHRLERAHAGEGLSQQDRDRLAQLEVRLDQMWDLLRQRRARRHAGLDPDDAQPRAEEVVEHYQQ